MTTALVSLAPTEEPGSSNGCENRRWLPQTCKPSDGLTAMLLLQSSSRICRQSTQWVNNRQAHPEHVRATQFGVGWLLQSGNDCRDLTLTMHIVTDHPVLPPDSRNNSETPVIESRNLPSIIHMSQSVRKKFANYGIVHASLEVKLDVMNAPQMSWVCESCCGFRNSWRDLFPNTVTSCNQALEALKIVGYF